jgi:hypothetical protein
VVSLQIASDGMLRGDGLTPLALSRIKHRTAAMGGDGEFIASASPGTTFAALLTVEPMP